MTTALEATLRRLADDATDLGLQWALIGGFAVSARAEPRFTRDIDVCVLVDDDSQAEVTTSAFLGRGYGIESLVEHQYIDRLATVRLRPPFSGGSVVDLLFASSGIEREVTRESDQIELVPGLSLPVARASHLAVLKLLSRDDATRPQDAADLVALRPVLTPADETDVLRLAALVAERGFHRERDLPSLARAFLGGVQG